jgi:hypothetical protein
VLTADEEEQRDSREEGRSSLRLSVSSASNSGQWRKESVTIIESQEPMEEDNEVNALEGDVRVEDRSEENRRKYGRCEKGSREKGSREKGSRGKGRRKKGRREKGRREKREGQDGGGLR